MYFETLVGGSLMVYDGPMTNMNMTFHESYGNLPTNILRLVRRFNVSPADFDFMLDQFNGTVSDGWNWVAEHIVSNSETGIYRPRFY